MGDQDRKRLFSERQGLEPTKTAIQIDEIDDALRNRIWNGLDKFFWQDAAQNQKSAKTFARRVTR